VVSRTGAEGEERIGHEKIGVEGVRPKTEFRHEMVERGSRGFKGQGYLRERLPGRGELLDFVPGVRRGSLLSRWSHFRERMTDINNQQI